MKRNKYALVVSVILLAALNCIAGEKESTAVIEAEGWLSLIDDGKYEESWKEASGLFKKSVNVDQWEQALKSVRIPLGQLISREVTSATLKTELPGVPEGEYVVIEFSTSFEKKESSVETVTSMLDPDGKWRVLGYFIK